MESKPGMNPTPKIPPVHGAGPRPPCLPKKHPIGNKLGWILSGVLVLVLVVVIVILKQCSSDEPSKSTLATATEGFFELHEVKLPIGPLLGGSGPSALGDAADDYKEAIKVYAANHDVMKETIDAMASWDSNMGPYTPPPGTMALFEKVYKHVADGAAKKEMKYFTPDMLDVRAFPKPCYDLFWLANDGPLEFLVHFYNDTKNYDKMEEVLRVEFVLGWHMANEHVRAIMGKMGLDIMNRVAGTMDDLYYRWEKDKHATAMKAAEEYSNEINRVYKQYSRKLEMVVWGRVPVPGDVFEVVQKDKDRAFRIEALLLCGVIRFTHSTRGNEADVAQAEKLIAKHVNDPDEFVRAAAASARDLTQAGFEKVGVPPTR